MERASTEQACSEFLNRYGAHNGPIEIFGDASGNKRQTSNAGAESDWQAIRAFFARHSGEFQVSYKYKRDNPVVRDRVAAMNGMLQNALGQSKLFVDPGCKHLVRDLERVAWKPGTTVLDQDTDLLALHSRIRAKFGDEPILITPVTANPIQTIQVRGTRRTEVLA